MLQAATGKDADVQDQQVKTSYSTAVFAHGEAHDLRHL